MSRIEDDEMKKEIKKAERSGRRKGWLARIRSFLIGVICGVLILTLVTSYIHGLSFVNAFKTFFSREAAVEGRDLTLENHGFFGYTAADFEQAVLGEEKQLKKLEVYSREVNDMATITKAGLARIKAFSKYQYITYHGTAVYTVDLSRLGRKDISLDEDTKTVTLTVPGVVLEPINIPSENIEFGEVQKNTVFAFGDIKLKPEDQAKIETEAKERMLQKLEDDNVAADAAAAAEHSIWEIFQPVISGVSPEYTLRVAFEEPAEEEAEENIDASASEAEGDAAGNIDEASGESAVAAEGADAEEEEASDN